MRLFAVLSWKISSLSLTFIIVSTTHGAFEPCSVCTGGEPITKPEGIIGMTEPVLIPDCQTLDSLVPYIDLNSVECEGTRVIGTICGCPIPDNACRLCGEELVTNSSLEVDDIVNQTIFLAGPPSRSYNCEYVQAALHMTTASDDEVCAYAKETLFGPCCTAAGDADNIFHNSSKIVEPCALCSSHNLQDPHRVISEGLNVNTTCAQINGKEMERGHCSSVKDECQCETSCPLCPDGTPVPWPQKNLNAESLNIPDFKDCGGLASAIADMDPDSDICLASRTFNRLCGCPQRKTHCNLCGSSAASVPYPEKSFIWARGDVSSTLPSYLRAMREITLKVPMTCEVFQSVQSALYDEDDTTCYAVQFQSGACGCDNTQIIALVWTQVGAGIVSTLASLWVLVDIFSSKERRGLVLHIMASMTVFNLVGSIAYTFSSSLMPQESGYYNAIGNDATCTFQGFLSQLSLTTTFFNMLLSVYFYLLVVNGGDKLNLASKWILPNLAVIGAVLALAALPYYDVSLTMCSLAMPPIASSLWPSIIFFMIPISIVSFVMVVMTVATARYVYRRRDTSDQGMVDDDNVGDSIDGSNDENKVLHRQAFWQSLSYTLICLFIWLPQFAKYSGFLSPELFPMLVISSIMLPSQGTFNAMVYFRALSWSCCCSKASKNCPDDTFENKEKEVQESAMDENSSSRIESAVAEH